MLCRQGLANAVICDGWSGEHFLLQQYCNALSSPRRLSSLCHIGSARRRRARLPKPDQLAPSLRPKSVTSSGNVKLCSVSIFRRASCADMLASSKSCPGNAKWSGSRQRNVLPRTANSFRRQFFPQDLSSELQWHFLPQMTSTLLSPRFLDQHRHYGTSWNLAELQTCRNSHPRQPA